MPSVRYSVLPSENISDSALESQRVKRSSRRWYKFASWTGFVVSLAILTLSSANLISSSPPLSKASSLGNRPCQATTSRREWRSLSAQEQKGYVDAVKCLGKTPSRLGLDQSLHDDFPWIHSRIGEYAHGAAPFLAWHRYFLHVYETALHDSCGWSGGLVYWDWSLDWQNITLAPIWSETAFGGNGNSSLQNQVLDGHCVDSGPFANLQVPYLDGLEKSHCLSRGFAEDGTLKRLSRLIKSNNVDTLLGLPSYETFNLGLENGPHIAIPRSIRGDFSLLTAPSDPVFFLHHTQLDRLWWQWQRRASGGHAWDYDGLASHNSTENASLDDSLPMGGLSQDVKVSSIIDAESAPLCYRYV